MRDDEQAEAFAVLSYHEATLLAAENLVLAIKLDHEGNNSTKADRASRRALSLSIYALALRAATIWNTPDA